MVCIAILSCTHTHFPCRRVWNRLQRKVAQKDYRKNSCNQDHKRYCLESVCVHSDIVKNNQLFYGLGSLIEGVVDDYIEKCAKFSQLKHPNVMEIVGVCLDGGAVPFLVMPFMSNGNLLQYLKTNRKNLVLPANNPPNELVGNMVFFAFVVSGSFFQTFFHRT